MFLRNLSLLPPDGMALYPRKHAFHVHFQCMLNGSLRLRMETTSTNEISSVVQPTRGGPPVLELGWKKHSLVIYHYVTRH
jgi:hypothetical protein